MAASSAEGAVIAIHSAEQWKEELKKAQDSKKLVVVDFTATWCGPCRIISPVFAEAAQKTPDVVFLKVDVDENKEVTAEWEVEAMPTFLFLKEGKKVHTIVGARKDELLKKITELATLTELTATA